MPSAGLYPIHTDRLTFRRDGRWYADDEPVEHERLSRLFSRHLRRKPSGGGYEIWIDERYHADVDVEDTPFVVTRADIAAAGSISIELQDGSTETLDPASLYVGEGEVLYCSVKGGTERARFLRPAYYQIAAAIQEMSDGSFQLRCGGQTHIIRQL